MTEEKEKMSTGKKAVIVLICVLLILSAAAYFAGVYYFTRHFLPGSQVNGFNCSYMTAQEAEDLLTKKVESYVLAIRTRGNGQESITAQQVGLTYRSDGSVQETIRNQDRFLWFLVFGQQKIYELTSSSSYHAEMLDQAVGNLQCMQNTVSPQDAYISDNGSEFVIEPEVEGSEPDRDKVLELAAYAMLSGRTVLDLEEEGCYKTPSVYRDDENLIRQCEQANQLTSVIITYDFADRTERVDRSVIKDWLVIRDGDCVLNKEKVAAYVYELGCKYDTVGCTREFETYDGRTVTVAGGDYGWAIDQSKETEALMEAVESGNTQVREPIYAYEGWSRDTNDIGYTYIEIDLTNQRMVLYVDGYPTVDSPVVTGNPNISGMETPVGCYALDAKESPAVLTGEGYEANVTYWMPFCGNVGIHDAPWRTQFGGNLYLLEGSHGCVNTPYEKAQEIFQRVEVGCPVVVYQ
ncbi:L,D-transpeptidase family protein [Blautia sp. HCP3S3_G3]|uniref:L,D-transpeptidase family protein n=1 Tax=Blautia sp. HCP3S3_G3 TaxID=3438913 RepID=UPI003F888E41